MIVGEKLEVSANLLLPCTPYNIYNCTVNRYIDIVIDGKLDKIIRFGIASKSKKIELINNLCDEFNEANGNSMSKVYSDIKKETLDIIIEIQRLQIAKILFVRDFNYSKKIIKSVVKECPFNEQSDKYIKFIDSQINQRTKKKEDNEKKMLRENKESEKATRSNYLENIMILGISAEAAYKTDGNIFLNEYATLIKLNKEKVKIYEDAKRDTNRR